jgi:chorismate-pyruvate lyase
MRIDVARHDLVDAGTPVMPQPSDLAASVADCLLTRCYRIDADQAPLMIITEWFLATLTPFLSSNNHPLDPLSTHGDESRR